MHFTVSWGRADYHFVTGGDENICKQLGALHTSLAADHPQIPAIVRHALSEPVAAGHLRRLAAEAAGSANPQRMSEQDVMREISRLISSGRMLVVECRLPEAPGIQPEAQAPPRPPQQKAPPPPTAKHWIEFKLIEEKTKRFISEATLKVNLPGRGKEEHTTEAKALRIDLASAGTADLLEITHLDLWEIVSIQSG